MLIRRHPKTMSPRAYINIITFTRCPICRPDSLHTSQASTSPRAARFPFRFKKKNTTTHWRNQGQCTLYPVGQSHGIAGGYPRPCPEISPSLPADISVLARGYLRLCSQISPSMAYHAPINSDNGLLPYIFKVRVPIRQGGNLTGTPIKPPSSFRPTMMPAPKLLNYGQRKFPSIRSDTSL